MKRATCILIILLPFCLAAQEYSLFKKEVFTASSGFTLPYRILLPEGFVEGKKYPLILFLHGAGERGADNEKQLTHGAKLFLDANNRKEFPAIVLFPQCPTDSYWGSVYVDRSTNPLGLTFDYSQPATPPLQAVIELINNTIDKGQLDETRIYVAGLSMGGMGTFEIVYKNPGLFAAATAICGGGDGNQYNKKMLSTSFRVFHGDQDDVVSVDESRKMVGKLTSLQADVYYKEYEGVNHNSWDRAFAEPDFISWFFRHSKK